MVLKVAALAIAVVLGAPHAAPALVVDSFEAGPFTVASNGAEEELIQDPLDTSVVANGSRRIVLLGATSAVATLAITAGDDGVAVDTEDGADLVLGYASPGIETFDWTDGGGADRLRITVAQASHPLSISLTVTSLTPGVEMQTAVIDAPAAGVYEVPFAAFGFVAPDPFATVYSFTFFAEQLLAVPGTSSFAVSDVRTVPEPAATRSAAMAVLALLACGAGRGLLSPNGPEEA